MGQNRKIELATAAEAEVFGALAVGRHHPLKEAELMPSVAVLRSLLGVLKKAGAATRPIKIGKSSLRLRLKNKQQMLVIQD